MIKKLFTIFVLVLTAHFCFAQPISAFCETEVTHFAGDPPSAIKLTIANVNATTMIVEIESATADPVNGLTVNGGSGATISNEDFSVPGKISRTLTWAVPPTDVVLNVLWGKTSFPGMWLLSQGDITVPFAAVCSSTPAPPTSAYCETEVTHFAGDPPSAIKLTIANVNATTMIVEIESANADPVDLLLVLGGSGATISNEDLSVPGKISRTLTWAVPPADVTLNLLWSKASFGGNWQLSQGDITVPFAAVCPVVGPPPVSAYCEAQTLHFGGDPGSAIILTIANVDATTMYVEIESANADAVDLLLVVGGSGATISDENTTVPGKISRTLTWAAPPANVMLNVLWSKASFGGNWQLSQGDIVVPFAATCPGLAPPPAASAYCATQAFHFGGDPGSGIFLTIANLSPTSMYVEIESDNADAVDLLLVVIGGGAVVSTENKSVPGKISRTISWNTPPANVALNILWSKASFGGNWQLSQGDITVPFAAACPLPPPPPAPAPLFCNTEVRHLGIPAEVASAILLTVRKINASMMIVEIESANGDPVDFLLVTGGSGAIVSAENTAEPGKISRTLTWNTPPPVDVTLNVLWSKASFGGNWQLSPGDVTVAFASSCAGAAVPTMGEWSMFLFALIMLTIGVVFVMSSQAKLRLANGQSASAPVNLRQFPFNQSNYLAAMKHALGLALVGFAVIYIGWGAIVLADLVGMGLSVLVVAYLIHLFHGEPDAAN